MKPAASPAIDWLSLSEASRVLGVSPATVRRWGDAGRLRVFLTPGGHRRFSRAGLERLLPSARLGRPSLSSAGLTPARLSRSYRRVSRGVSAELPWVLALSDDQRELFRVEGHLLAERLLQHLEARDPEIASDLLRDAASNAARYGRLAVSIGLSLSQTVEGFLRFRAPFHRELALAAQRRGFDAHETTSLLASAERAMDQLLVATMTGHSVETVTNGRRARRVAGAPGSRR
ncbi:MAG: helix-turn-helix domain-containing protein [Chloroflexi bacterium]|nr:helix-turn-helix domain-containing protein [Chloroflexota bacterium]